jgi:hypothetical protein
MKTPLIGLVLLLLSSPLGAYTVVIVSSAAPVGIEQQFIASSTAQYQMDYFKNPLASNTYTLKLYGTNPNFNPPPPLPSTLQQSLALASTVYVYGFASGMAYERSVDTSMISSYLVNCSSAGYFGASTGSWNTSSCSQALMAAEEAIFSLATSTPPVLPPPGF